MAWAVEGCGSHGAGLAAALAAAGHQVIEAGRPRKAGRRGGKSDQLDAVRAGRQALAASDPARPHTGETREALRILLAVREHATKTRTARVNTFTALIVTAPEHLRAQFRGRPTARQVRDALTLRPAASQPASEQHLRIALHQLAAQITDLDASLARTGPPAHSTATAQLRQRIRPCRETATQLPAEDRKPVPHQNPIVLRAWLDS